SGTQVESLAESVQAVEKWIVNGPPGTGTAAGSVADVLTTTTSPSVSSAGRSVNGWWVTSPVPRRPTSSRTPSRVRPRASGGALAESSGASAGYEGALMTRST